MNTYTIDIPAPVIQVEVQYQPRVGDLPAAWLAKIEIGGVTVMQRSYNAEWNAFQHRPENFAEDEDEVRNLILAIFGNKLKKLLED